MMEDTVIIHLYQNVFYYMNTDKLIHYQQYHRTLEDAKKTFNEQSNGDRPAFIMEITGNIVHNP